MKLYGNDFSPNSNKVRFALNAMGIVYEFQSMNLMAGEQKQESFLKITPVGRIPVLVDDSFTIFESNAIIRYLAEKTNSPLYPKDVQGHSLVNQWMDFSSIHVGAGAMGKVFFNTIIYKFMNAPLDENSLKEGRQFLGNYLKLIEEQLSKNSFLCGPAMTLADINLLSILDPSDVVQFDLSPFPKVVAWRKNLQGQAFYQEVFKSYTEFLTSLMPKS